MIRHMPSLARLFLLLLTLALATSASGQNTFKTRITVTSQCSAQHALFGPRAQHYVTVICQPGMTPYQMESFILNSLSNDSESDKTEGNAIAFDKPSSKKILSPPLSTPTSAAKVVFVVF